MTNVNPQEINEVVNDGVIDSPQSVADEIEKILWGEQPQDGVMKLSSEAGMAHHPEMNKKDESLQKLIYKLSKDIAETRKENRDAEEVARLKEVAMAYNGDDQLLPFSEIYEDVKNSDESKAPLIKTGFSNLDNVIKKLKQKHLVILAGIMKHGKTSFAIDLTTRMKEWNPLWLPIEESAEELMEKFLDRGEQAPHGYSPRITGVDVTTDWCELKIVEGIVKYGCKIVFIDNLDWVKSVGHHPNDSKPDRITQACKEIKGIAKKWNVAIVLLCHVNKNSKADANPTYEDIKGSSGVGQVGDKVILLWRETKRGKNGELEITNNTNISVQANRQGGVGNIKMTYENGHYIEFDWVQDREESRFGDYAKMK